MQLKAGDYLTVTVIGGGASGLMAAITAARAGASVFLLERQPRVGKKLLATGNGRCNLTNINMSSANFHGENAAFARPALSCFDTGAALSFFKELGLVTIAEQDGRVYPLSDQAGSVVDVLRFAAESLGVILRTDFYVQSIQRKGGGFLVCAEDECIASDKVIICCGGLAGGKLGGSKSGYELLTALGHHVTKLCPALVQLKTDTAFVKALKGVRADAEISVLRGRTAIAKGGGEVQFTEYGVSGPAIFELSRAVSAGGDGLFLELDLMRPMQKEELFSAIVRRIDTFPQLKLEDLLTGMLQNRLGRTVLRYAGYELNAPITSLTKADIEKIAVAVKCFKLKVIGTMGFDGAQVTAGGIKTSEFNAETLESRLVPGLYAAGEVLDIDGDCGGYNLQWAWASGHLAGQTL